MKIKILLSILSVIITSLILESICWTSLKVFKKKTNSFFLDLRHFSKQRAHAWDAKAILSVFDPFLGYSYDPSCFPESEVSSLVPGFAVYETATAEDCEENTLIILVLGGSTSTPSQEKSWPFLLSEYLNLENISAKIYNGAVSGYTSSQELLKLLRDGRSLTPNLIISLHGVNDIGFIHSQVGYPLYNHYLFRESQKHVGKTTHFFLPSTMKVIESVRPRYVSSLNYGVPDRDSAAETWYRNICFMNALAEQMNAKYFSVLQPIIGASQFEPTEDEKKMFVTAESVFGSSYLDAVNSFYDDARQMGKKETFFRDFTEIFDGESGVFSDARHQTLKGRQIIVSNVVKKIFSDEMLNELKQE